MPKVFTSSCLIITIISIFLLGVLSAIPAVLLTSKSTTTINTESGFITQTNSNDNSTTTNATTMVTTVTITSNLCTSSWFDVTIIYHCDNCTIRSNYKQISYNYTAVGNTTFLSFAMRRQMGYFALDDISARDLANPSVNLIFNGGFQTGTLFPWNYCILTGSSGGGSVQSTANAITYNNYTYTALSGSYYYLGGAATYPGYISQTFPTNIGDQYTTITFSYVYVGNGSQSSDDFMLSL